MAPKAALFNTINPYRKNKYSYGPYYGVDPLSITKPFSLSVINICGNCELIPLITPKHPASKMSVFEKY